MKLNTPEQPGGAFSAKGMAARPEQDAADKPPARKPAAAVGTVGPSLIQSEPAVYRKVLLRVVFWALGLAACFGAAGVIFAGHDSLWRIVGTCVATAVGAFLVLAASRQLDGESTWVSGVMAIWLLVVEYAGTLAIIWSVFRSASEPLGLSMLFLAATGIPAIAFASLRRRVDSAVSGKTGVYASGAVFALLMVGTWGEWLGHARAERWSELGLALATFGILAVLCLIGAGTDRRHWRWLGVAAAALAFGISAYALLMEIHETSSFFVCVVSLAAVVAHANAMAWCPLRPGQRWLLWGTVGAGIATAAFVDVARITSPWQDEMLGRFAGAMAIVAGCGTLAMLILARINQRSGPVAATPAEVREIALTCPRCRKKQTIPIGSGKCPECGLVIKVCVEEGEAMPASGF